MDLQGREMAPGDFRETVQATYSPRAVEETRSSVLRTVCAISAHAGARAELVSRAPKEFSEASSAATAAFYGRPLHYVAFSGTWSPSGPGGGGLHGRGIILEARAIGLDTCWVGGFFRPEIVKQDLTLSEIRAGPVRDPVGYAVPKGISPEAARRPGRFPPEKDAR